MQVNVDQGSTEPGMRVGIGFGVKDRWRFTAKRASHFMSRQPRFVIRLRRATARMPS